MELEFSLRPKQPSLPIIFLEVFMLDSIDWPTHLKLQNLLKVEE